MRELVGELRAWLDAGEVVALATVVETWGSSPRQAGAAMAVAGDGRVVGSVSGGCVETAVVEAALEVAGGAAPRLLSFDVPDERAMAVGLPCGGRLRVFVERLERLEDDAAMRAWLDALEAGRPVARLIGVDGDRLGERLVAVRTGGAGGGELAGGGRFGFDVVGELADGGGDGPSHDLLELAAEVLGRKEGQIVEIAGSRVFACAYPPPDRLVVVGAVHIAQTLVPMARAIGYRTIIVDPRAALATRQRFPDADDILDRWPSEAFSALSLNDTTDVVVLSHDDKIDDPAVRLALDSPARYVGALGSRKRTAARAERLAADGVAREALDRLDAPIGLAIGARTPEEIAVSILARLVEVRSGGVGGGR